MATTGSSPSGRYACRTSHPGRDRALIAHDQEAHHAHGEGADDLDDDHRPREGGDAGVVRAGEGVADFEKYRVDASEPLVPMVFVPDELPPPAGVSVTGEMWK